MTESIQIYLHSANADKYYNNSVSDCEFLLPPIEIPDGFHIYLSVQNVSIPYSFYNINSSTNKLSYTLNNSVIILTLINGNYNITQLVTYLTSIMSNFTITYNIITNKLTFVHSTYDFTFNNASTCLLMLGFTSLISYTSSSLSLISVNCVNIQSIKRINLASNLITYNINKSTTNNYSILCSVPVNKPSFSVIEYNNLNNFRTNLFINNISTIKIKLIDENGNLIDLNGCHFCVTIQLDIESFK
jgi:hypothetical protein